MARLVSVNVGVPRRIETSRGTVTTSIFKSPTAARVRAEGDNLEGDRQADLESHGGENKAVYGYPIEHYRHWMVELARNDLEHGQFGENLTTSGLLESELGIGDRLAIGSAVLQVTQPRSPCYKLGLRMGDAQVVKAFLQSGRPGFYFRIDEPGELGVGDEIHWLSPGMTGLTVHDIWALSYGTADDPHRLETALEIPSLGEEWLRPMRLKLERHRA